MTKGLVLGLVAQVAFTIGFIFIAHATFTKNPLLKTTLNLCFSGALAFAIVADFFLSGAEDVSVLGHKHMLFLAIGSVLVLIIGDGLFIEGISVSNVTTVAYTSLARPAVALILETLLGRTTVTIQDFAGFVLPAAAFILISTRRAKVLSTNRTRERRLVRTCLARAIPT
jgi:drug/metabolite transporter (DMT)-like permease